MKIGLHDNMSNLRLGFLILNYKSARLTKKLSIQVRNKFSNHNVNICVVNNDDDISDAEKGDLIEVSDDFMFQALFEKIGTVGSGSRVKGMRNFTIVVGKRDSPADLYMNDVYDVEYLLTALANHPSTAEPALA